MSTTTATTSNNITATVSGNISTAAGQSAAGQSAAGSLLGSTQAEAPPGWKVIKTKRGFMQDEVHESPLNGKAIYLSSLNISNIIGRFHWRVYREQHTDVEIFSAGIALEGVNMTTISNVVFTNPIDHAKFEDWLEGYSKLFRSREALYTFRFPTPPSRLGEMLPIPWVHDDSQSVDVAIWLLRQCLKPVYALGEVFLFQSEQDAIAYKLKFS